MEYPCDTLNSIIYVSRIFYELCTIREYKIELKFLIKVFDNTKDKKVILIIFYVEWLI